MYTEIDQVVIDVLKEFGTVYSASRTLGDGSVVAQSFTGIQVEKVSEDLPGSDLIIGDWKLLFVSTNPPMQGDRIALHEGVHSIMKTEPIVPAGVVIGHWAWARR